MVVLGAAGWASGMKPLVFTSGSMSPTITTGSLALARTVDPADLGVGDVASIARGDGERVTHRVVATAPRGSETALVLRGDANSTNDPEPYVVSEAQHVLVSVPGVGRVVAHLDGVAGIVLVSVAGIGLLAMLRRPGRRAHRRPLASSGQPIAAFSIGSMIVCGALVAGSVPTAAYWTDTVVAGSGAVTAAGPSPTPGNGVCSDAGSNIMTSWTSVGQRYRYQLTLHRFDNDAQVGAAIFSPAVTSTTAAAQITPTTFSPAAVAATGQLNFRIRVRALPVASTTWLSPASLAIPIRYTADRNAVRCGIDGDTVVTIDSLLADTGSSSTDFVTNVAANTLRGTGEPGATISVRRGGSQIGTATVTPGGTWSAVVTLTEGLAAISAVATDPSGNTATASRNIRLDTVKPAALPGPGLASPCLNPDGSTADGNLVSTAGTARWCKLVSRPFNATYPTDVNDSGPHAVNGLQYRDNGGAWTNFPTSNGFATGSYAMGESPQRDMQARAVDLAGNIGDARSVTYYIDGTAPTVAVTSPTQIDHASPTALRNAVSTACGTTNRVGCGTIVDGISGPSTTVAPSWQLRRDYQVQLLGIGLVSRTVYLNASGNYQAGATSSSSTLLAGGFRIAVPTTSTTFYPSAGLLETGSSYILTISGTSDVAGNVATPFVRTFQD